MGAASGIAPRSVLTENVSSEITRNIESGIVIVRSHHETP